MNKNGELHKTKCAVCNAEVMVDEIGNGEECFNCGWVQDSASLKIPHSAGTPILISLNKARKLYNDDKPLKPDFVDFVDTAKVYGEMEFYHNKIRYAVIGNAGSIIKFGTCDYENNAYATFKDLDEFAEKATINGRLLKDIWDEVENSFYLG